MKRYRAFPFSRDAVEMLWVGTGAPPANVAIILAAFDAEDRQEEAALAQAREIARAENAAYEQAQGAIRRAQWAEGSDG
jgi:hypothetical protein